jgi:hypothetical protein
MSSSVAIVVANYRSCLNLGDNIDVATSILLLKIISPIKKLGKTISFYKKIFFRNLKQLL